jgi:anti-anti-sigma factor
MKYELQPDCLAVVVPGNLVSTSVEAFRLQFDGILEDPKVRKMAPKTMELDLRQARQMDSAGLNLLVTLVKLGRERGFKLRALVANPTLQRTLQFTRMDRILDVVPVAEPAELAEPA